MTGSTMIAKLMSSIAQSGTRLLFESADLAASNVLLINAIFPSHSASTSPLSPPSSPSSASSLSLPNNSSASASSSDPSRMRRLSSSSHLSFLQLRTCAVTAPSDLSAVRAQAACAERALARAES